MTVTDVGGEGILDTVELVLLGIVAQGQITDYIVCIFLFPYVWTHLPDVLESIFLFAYIL